MLFCETNMKYRGSTPEVLVVVVVCLSLQVSFLFCLVYVQCLQQYFRRFSDEKRERLYAVTRFILSSIASDVIASCVYIA